MSSTSKPRRLAPLNPTDASASKNSKLAGIVFDVDGTLCEPQNYMFQEMRDALGIPKSVDILGHISSLPPDQQPAAYAKIEAIERQAMAVQKPTAGLQELMEYLEKRGVRKGICTRNFDMPIDHLLTTFLPTHKFSPIITRAFTPPKPHPAGILEICRQWDLEDASRVIMVGDSPDDFAAADAARCFGTVMVRHTHNEQCVGRGDVSVVIARLDELVNKLEEGFEVDRDVE